MKTRELLSGRWPLRVLPALILVTGIFLTWLLAAQMRQDEIAQGHVAFEIRAKELVAGIERRLASNGQILRGVAGLFASSGEVTRQEFRNYVTGLQLSEYYPGMQGIGFAEIVPHQGKARHVARIRAEGFPDYDILPPGDREFYSAVVYVEPDDWRNRRAMGFDLLTEPIRLSAAARARDTGQAVMTGKVTLRQETDQNTQAGVLLFVPVYRQGAPLSTVEQRQAALLGWAYSALRVKDLLDRYLDGEYPELRKRIGLRVYAAESSEPQHLIFDSPAATSLAADHYHVRQKALVHGTPWTFQIAPLPAYWETEQIDKTPWIVMAVGGTLSAMLALVSLVLIRSHLRVVATLQEASHAHREQAKQEALLRAIYDSSSVAICLIGLNGSIIHANQHMAEMFRYSIDELIALRFSRLLPTEAHEDVRQRFEKLITDETRFYSAERIYLRKDGTEFWGQVTGRSVRDADDKVIGIVVVIEDISERREAEARIYHLAHHDYLTGLPNRVLFVDHATRALELARRHQRRMAILFIDLDRFKPINDLYGHAAGDQVLRTIAQRLHDMVRASDTICRQGGDEFVILLQEFDELASVEKLAWKLHASIQTPCMVDGQALNVSAAIGIACYPEHGNSVDQLIQQADSAMYRAKTDPEHPIHFAAGPSEPAHDLAAKP